jgi:hypothetical protein
MPNLRDDHLPPVGYITPVYPTCYIVMERSIGPLEIKIERHKLLRIVSVLIYNLPNCFPNYYAVGSSSEIERKSVVLFSFNLLSPNFVKQGFYDIQITTNKFC